MLRRNRWIVLVVVLASIAAVALSACGDSTKEVGAADEPATVEPIPGTDVSRVKLSAEAEKRLGIETATVRERGSGTKVIPYSAVIYDASGRTFTYTSSEPRVFVRASISVRRIDGNEAILSRGPKSGTSVVTVGSQELFGTEHSVEED
jgi:hypothetical protein